MVNEHTRDADISIHESFLPPNLLVTKQMFPVLDALHVGTHVHASPPQFGKVMGMTKSRMAVAYHFFNDSDIAPEVHKQIRSVYEGPLSLATDYMVFNVTKDGIKARLSNIDEDIFPEPPLSEKLPADPDDRIGFLEFISNGRVVFKVVIARFYASVNEQYGTNHKAPH